MSNPQHPLTDSRSAQDGPAPEGFILKVMKYDNLSENTRPSAFAELPCDPKTEPLVRIRWWLINHKYMDKRHAKSPFCTSDGSEVDDSLKFGSYVLMDKSDDKVTHNTIYYKSIKRRTGMDESTKAFLKERLDLSTKDPPALLEAKTKALASSFSASDWKASTGSNQVVHPADMTEKHWSIVLQDSNALYGQLVVREVVKQEVEKSENSDVKKSEIPKEIILYKFKPAPYPAFQLKERKHPQVQAALEDAKRRLNANKPESKHSDNPPDKVTFKIPRFRIIDNSDVEVKELASSEALSMAHSSSTTESFEAGAGGGVFGVSADVKAGHGETDQIQTGQKTELASKHIYVSYNFPRVEVYLEPNDLELTKECEGDAEALLAYPNDREVRAQFEAKYGKTFVTELQLGGQLYSLEDSKNVAGTEMNDKIHAVKTSASASVSGFGFSASTSYSKESSNQDKKTKETSNLNHNMIWHAKGGDTLLCNNPPAWCSTVASFYNWRVIKNKCSRSMFEMIKIVKARPPDLYPAVHLLEFQLRNGGRAFEKATGRKQEDCPIFSLFTMRASPFARPLHNVFPPGDKRWATGFMPKYEDNMPRTTILQIVARRNAVAWDNDRLLLRYGHPYQMNFRVDELDNYAVEDSTLALQQETREKYDPGPRLIYGMGRISNVEFEFRHPDHDSPDYTDPIKDMDLVWVVAKDQEGKDQEEKDRDENFRRYLGQLYEEGVAALDLNPEMRIPFELQYLG